MISVCFQGKPFNYPVIQVCTPTSNTEEAEVERFYEMATHSSILAWKISWTEEPGGLQSMGSQRVGHDWAANTYLLGERVSLRHTFKELCPTFSWIRYPHLCLVCYLIILILSLDSLFIDVLPSIQMKYNKNIFKIYLYNYVRWSKFFIVFSHTYYDLSLP